MKMPMMISDVIDIYCENETGAVALCEFFECDDSCDICAVSSVENFKIYKEQQEKIKKPFKFEHRDGVIKTIVKLRKKGASYYEISNKLNGNNVKTFSNKGKWHPQTVHKICDNIIKKSKK